jgi:hypothetical protein
MLNGRSITKTKGGREKTSMRTHKTLNLEFGERDNY